MQDLDTEEMENHHLAHNNIIQLQLLVESALTPGPVALNSARARLSLLPFPLLAGLY